MEKVQEKLDRKTIEKNRRVYMKGLISQLISLVPPHHFNPPKNMLSQHDQIEQVASYIKQLSEKVEELKKRRNELITSTSLKNPIYDHHSSAFPVVKVSESGSTLEVVIVSETKKNFFLHQVVKIIEEGGAEVVSVSISTSPHNIIHIFHAQVMRVLHVNQSGGNETFKTINDAINQVPVNNPHWIKILVEHGNYREQVLIPENKPFIYLQGSGEENTKLEWDRHDEIVSDGTFMSQADNVVVRNMTFINTYNYPPERTKNQQLQAVAVMVSGDKSAFYNVTFLGVQDTLFDKKGRHYFNNCTIEGKVDFIFGAGQSLYENCKIRVNGPGAITAQGREKLSDTNGFVFKDCTIVGKGLTLLGRAWRECARVFFLNTDNTDTKNVIITPEGWDHWNNTNLKDLTFGKYHCKGLGANNLELETEVTDEMLQKFGNITYVDPIQEGWIAKQPRP